MPDLLHRFDIEKYVGDGFQQALDRQRKEYVSAGLQATADKPDTYWEKHKWELAAIALLLLRRPWDSGSSFLAGSIGHIAGRKERDAAYLEWAAKYGKRLAGQVVDTSREIVAAAAVRKAAGEKLSDAERSLVVISSDDRAERIGATETTRASVAGEFAMAKAFNIQQHRRGFNKLLQAYWHTERDGRVCPICRPLDGEPYASWSQRFAVGPPAHVMCRCWLDWR